MASKTNVFDDSVYDSCSTVDCKNQTQHKSGLCPACRTTICYVCGVKFVASNPVDADHPRCGHCKAKNRRVKITDKNTSKVE